MKVAFAYPEALGPGGYPRDARWLVGALRERGVDISLVARPGPHTDGLGGAPVVGSAKPGSFDLVHVWGGIFSPSQLLGARRALRRAATVVSPLGQLMPDHVRRKGWKKRPYLQAMSGILRSGFVAHVLSQREREDAQRVMRPAAAFEATLGLYPAPYAAAGAAGDYVLFLGRNDVFHKGIDIVLEGYARATAEGLALPLVVAGNEWGDSRREIASILERTRPRVSVELLGPVTEERKWELLAGARCLVFQSRWDGPPRPIREALAVGTPAIVSPGTNMGSVVEGAGAGRCTDGPGAVARALHEVADAEVAARWRAGAVGLQEALAWEKVAAHYVSGYEMALSG
jgi:glycosyltransferase involved in cell wall biosynthesis